MGQIANHRTYWAKNGLILSGPHGRVMSPAQANELRDRMLESVVRVELTHGIQRPVYARMIGDAYLQEARELTDALAAVVGFDPEPSAANSTAPMLQVAA